MSGQESFIVDFSIVLGTSALGGYIAHRLRQPLFLGYLASGLIVGPFGLELLSDTEQIKSLAEIGIVFLLFTQGVEVSLTELKRFQKIALQGSLLQMGLTLSLVTGLVLILGWVQSFTQALFFGILLALSSTAIVLKTLNERGETQTLHGQIMLTILIAQDIAFGLVLAILPILNDPANLGSALGSTFLKIILFLTFAILAGRWLIPHLMQIIAQTESSELFLLSVIALVLGVGLITTQIGLSVEIGAFVAGLMIAEIDYSDQALVKILPLRDTFASLFFVSLGMLVDPSILISNLGIILALVLMVMVGKAGIILPIILRFGYSFKTAVIVSVGLNQIGEFSFVLALGGLELGLIDQEQYLLLVGTAAITMVLTPVGLNWAPQWADRLLQIPKLQKILQSFQSPKMFSSAENIRDHVVVAGYGRVGQIVVKILRNQGHLVLVIENSEAAIQQLKADHIPYIFGDAESGLVLKNSHLSMAKALAIALPDPASTRLLLKRALKIAPHLDIVVRSHNNREIDILNQLGAREVVQPEFEAALEMGTHILGTLGELEWRIQSVLHQIRSDRYLSIRSDYASLRNLNQVLPELHHEWMTVSLHSALDGVQIGVAEIRRQTGVAIMAIQQKQETLYYPKGEMMLQSSDRLLVVGNSEEIAEFRKFLEK